MGPQQQLLALLLLATALAWPLAPPCAAAAPLPACDQAILPGEGFGGSVTITNDCMWRQQQHFITTLTGEQRDYPGPLEAPIIYLEPAPPVPQQSGPSRLVLNNVVLANFSISSPSLRGGPVLWPTGILQPGPQPGGAAQRLLLMSDVKIIVGRASIQEYVAFFANRSTLVYTDNATFVHVPYYADAQTVAVSVGLLLGLPDTASPADLAASRPAPGHNFVLATDQTTLVPVLRAGAGGAGSRLPLLIYLSTNLSLATSVTKAQALLLNRPVLLVGKATDVTSLDLGMDVNSLVLGPQGRITASQLVLENLALGDAASLARAGSFSVLNIYALWAVAFDRAERPPVLRIQLHNCSLVVSAMELEQYLFKATLFRVQPAGFDRQLERLSSLVVRWEGVSWLEATDSVFTAVMQTSGTAWAGVNLTSAPAVAKQLPEPKRSAAFLEAAAEAAAGPPGAPGGAPVITEYQLTHIGEGGMSTVALGGLGSSPPPGARELIMLTTNISFAPQGQQGKAAPSGAAALGGGGSGGGGGGNSSSGPPLDVQLRQFLSDNVARSPQQRHVLVGIVTPPVALDLAYLQDLVTLPPTMPAEHFSLVNLMAQHLPQGPRAAQPDATVLLPDVWTHLLWSIDRSVKSVVTLSNVTLWVPAAEFSFIRSHTGEQPTNFSINLQGDANMMFYDVRDLRADGLHIQHYVGPGMQADSLTLRVEPGWSMNGQPPRGFWATSGPLDQPEPAPGRMSDAMVVVLAVSLVTAIVACVLAGLAFLFWRKRAAETRLNAALVAASEDMASEGKSHTPNSQYAHSAAGSRVSHGSRNSGGGGGSRTGSGRQRSVLVAGGSQRLGGLLLDASGTPVHDSSDSYHLQDRAALTEELARSQLGPAMHVRGGARGSTGGDSSGGVPRGGGAGKPLPPAATGSNNASDACLARLQSAISIMSQDVLSRRLQYNSAGGDGGNPLGKMGAGAAAGAVAAAAAVAGAAGLAAGGGGGGGGGNLPRSPRALARRSAAAAGGNDGGGASPTLRLQQQQQQLPGGLALARTSGSGRQGSSGGYERSPRAAAAAGEQSDSSAGSGAVPHGAAAARGGAIELARLQLPPNAAAAGGIAAGAGVAAAAMAAGAPGSLAKTSYTSTPGGSSRAGGSSSGGGGGGLDQLKLLQLVGQGTFGQVYKALWRRRCVAVKVLQLPAHAGGSDVAPWQRGMGRASSHREKMAVMETVVSTTMSHPNIVQVYTYVLEPLMQGLLAHSSKATTASGQAGKWPPPQQQQQQQAADPLSPEQRQQLAAPAAAALVAQAAGARQQQQQPAGNLPPDPQAPERQQQQQQVEQQLELQQQQLAQELQQQKDQAGVRGASLDGSSQSLQSLQLVGPGHMQQQQQQDRPLTPEMARAAAAALPAAAAAGNGHSMVPLHHGGGGGGSSSGGDSEDGDGGGDDGASQRLVFVGWELRLVMEFCDAGSLRTALDHKLLVDRATGLTALECVLFLAHDVACAMMHLHSEHLLHGDLKASNVLLKRTAPRIPLPPEQAAAGGGGPAGGQPQGAHGSLRGQGHPPGHHHGHHHHHPELGSLAGQGLGLMAKVADFGLSLTLGPSDTHVSQMHMGTLSHMAPELLLHGRASKASDVYAYGILLWELATGRRPYSGTPVGMLAHKVAQQGWRPAWPGGCSQPVQVLAEHCWTPDPAERPTFEEVVEQLEAMADHLDELKAQQAHAMAAAAAPLISLGPGGAGGAGGAGDSDGAGHELTPSMLAELMPSGFSGGSGCSGIPEEGGEGSQGMLYKMSELSGGSGDRPVLCAAAGAGALVGHGTRGSRGSRGSASASGTSGSGHAAARGDQQRATYHLQYHPHHQQQQQQQANTLSQPLPLPQPLLQPPPEAASGAASGGSGGGGAGSGLLGSAAAKWAGMLQAVKGSSSSLPREGSRKGSHSHSSGSRQGEQ